MKLPKVETLVILAFLGSVLLWAMSKCNAKRSELAGRDRSELDDERPPRRDTVFVPQQPAPATYQQPQAQPLQQPQYAQSTPPGRTPQLTPQPTQSIPAPVPGNRPAAAPAAAASPKYSTLYVAIDGLKMRKEPGLKGDLVSKLELYEPVSFLNQKTEWTQEISLGTEKVTDHWVKVRTRSGKEGWVFGAGVHYYKMKRKGTLE